MGLDMYLHKKVYVENWAHMKKEDLWHITAWRGTEKVEFQLPICYLEFKAAYWRKANAIHQWFVETTQGGRDECQQTYVSVEQLKELLALCEAVVNTAKVKEVEIIDALNETHKVRVISNTDEIAELLPTQSGFFFGSTEYDEWYLQDIELTIKQLKSALADPFLGEFYYQASW
jgi:hypothetical protein